MEPNPNVISVNITTVIALVGLGFSVVGAIATYWKVAQGQGAEKQRAEQLTKDIGDIKESLNGIYKTQNNHESRISRIEGFQEGMKVAAKMQEEEKNG